MSESHSDIGASSAYRWMNCPGSVRLCAGLPPRPSTDFARLGTAAHYVAEQCLRKGIDPAAYLGQEIDVEGEFVKIAEDTVTAVALYVDKVVNDQRKYGGLLNVEETFRLDWLLPGMYGRNDASLTPRELFGTARIYDYKNGRSAVQAERNVQCMYYALGVLGKDNPLMSGLVVCTIVQPNCFGKAPVDSWECPVKDLYAWAYDALLPAAKRTREPDAPLACGSWCGFCAAAGVCPQRGRAALQLLGAAELPAELPAKLPEVAALAPDQVGKLAAFFTGEAFQAWLKALVATEVSLLQSGTKVSGRKLVELTALGNRKWASEAEAVEAFRAELGDELYTTILKSPTQVEKLLAARKVPKVERDARIGKLVTREETKKLVVVSEEDARPAFEEQRNKAIELL